GYRSGRSASSFNWLRPRAVRAARACSDAPRRPKSIRAPRPRECPAVDRAAEVQLHLAARVLAGDEVAVQERGREQQDERLVLALADAARRRVPHLLQELLADRAVQERQFRELLLGEERVGVVGVARAEERGEVGRAVRLLRLLQNARRQGIGERLLQ